MPFARKWATVTETPGGRYVNFRFDEDKNDRRESQDEETIQIRIAVDPAGHPRTTECHLEALERTQELLGAEIDRLKSLADHG